MAGKTPEELALEKIEEAASRGATAFDLSGLGIKKLPREIGQLKELHSAARMSDMR